LHSADAAAAASASASAGKSKKGDEKSQNESQREECKFSPSSSRWQMMSCNEATMTPNVAL